MTRSITTAKIAVFRNVHGKMVRRWLTAGTEVTVVEVAPSPSWSKITLDGVQYLIAGRVLRDDVKAI